MAAVYAYNVLTNRTTQSTRYIERYANRACLHGAGGRPPPRAAASAPVRASGPYAGADQGGGKGPEGRSRRPDPHPAGEKQPLEVVDEALIPALDIVGDKYEKGTLFLPQLLQAASAAQSAFEEIKTAIAHQGGTAAARAASSSPRSRGTSTTSARTSSRSSSKTTALRSSTWAATCRWRRS